MPRGGDIFRATAMRIPRSTVTRLEIAANKKRHWALGLLFGAVLGAALAVESDVDSELCKVNRDVLCDRAEAIGVGLGAAGLGALVGGLIQTDRWTPVALDAQLPPPVERAALGARAPLSFRFSFRF